MPSKTLTIKDPKGGSLTITSPDGSMPTEQQLDQMFKIKYGGQRKDIIDIMAGVSPQELEAQGQLVLASIQQAGKDLLTIPAHFFNQLALNYPRSAMRTAGYEYPEKAQSGLTQSLANISGVVGGFKNPLLRMGGLLGQPLKRKIVQGAITGGTYAPSDNIIGLKERLGQAGLGAIAPLGIAGLQKGGQATGRAITKTGKFISKHVGGITDAARETIKRLGVNRVFDPLKSQADYITQNLAPRIYNKLVGFRDLANKAYNQALDSAPEGKQINIRSAIEQAGNRLKRLGLITNNGNMTELGQSEIARDSVYGKLLDFYKSADAISGVGRLQGKPLTQGQMIKAFRAERETLVNKEQYTFLRDKLNSLYKNKPSDVDVSKVANSFYQAGEDSGIKGLQKARELQRKFFEIEDMIDINKISRSLIRAKNPEWTNIVREEGKKLVKNGILSDREYNDIFDDLMAHFVNREFGVVSATPGSGGGGIASRAGFIKKGVADLTKQYYKKTQPQIQGLKSGLSQALQRIVEAQGRL